MAHRTAMILAAAFAVLGASVAAPAFADPPAYTNRLAASDDPYLLLHAHNPVDWYPWGKEALERAKKENKPIFLSIGFSTCFWCRTMERETFSDPAIAKLMNDWFINIKVDRERRPDLDQIYGLASDVLAGQAGYPDNLLLTPDEKPFYAGTYLPPKDDEFGQEGFVSTITRLHEEWTEEHGKALAAADATLATMRKIEQGQTAAAATAITPDAWLTRAAALIVKHADTENGGYGNGLNGRYPDAPLSRLLLTAQRVAPQKETADVLAGTLDAIAFGGIDDQLGGGFHRYSVDRTWSIPHYEKMLPDNAQLIAVYADASVLLHRKLYRDVATATADWLGREMMAPQGGFYSAEGSQVNGVEGGNYKWSRQEITTLLGKTDAAKFFAVYNISSDEPAQNGVERGILRVRVPIADTLARAGASDAASMLAALAPERAALRAARDKRPQPGRDDKIVSGWNGLAIGALADAGKRLGRPAYIAWATRAADRVWNGAWDAKNGVLAHDIVGNAPGAPGFLDDYALLGDGFLTLADATGDAVWRTRAGLLADALLRRFAQADGGLASSPEAASLIIPAEDAGDDAQPSGTSASVALLLRLASEGAGQQYADAAGRVLHRISGGIAAHPDAWPSAIVAAVDGKSAISAAPGAMASAAAPVASSAMPQSADHVHASAALRDANGKTQLLVTLHIDPGYHVNANPASFDYLVPTTLHLGEPAQISYPAAEHVKLAFAPEGLDVYEGAPVVVATLGSAPAHAISGEVQVQACTDRICLPPSKLDVEAAPPSN